MNIKFNLGSFEIKVPESDKLSCVNAVAKDVTFEVTDISVAEYASVFKVLITEGVEAMKVHNEILKAQKEQDFSIEKERDAIRYEAEQMQRKTFRNVESSFGSEIEKELVK